MSVPVLPRNTFNAGPVMKFSRNVPIDPAIDMPLTKSLFAPARCKSDVSKLHVNWVERSNPEPSPSATPAEGSCHSTILSATTCNPARRVAAPCDTRPISFNNNSAVLLSLFVNISATMSRSGTESIFAICGVSGGAVSISGDPLTNIPLSFKSRVNSFAAANAGFASFTGESEVLASLIISAPSGPASVPRIPSPQLGEYRSRS
ncbi:unannotated protein [freshwater metagenome]|uniref:Unannotated protein n=1 Tax=freshwater metagenome TaxID=449393 RepID=A0A6J6LCP5_9ZZZZ